MSYEDAIVEDKCCQAPLEEQCDNALKHYEGISRVAMHWNSLIAKAITEYPALLADRERLEWLIEHVHGAFEQSEFDAKWDIEYSHTVSPIDGKDSRWHRTENLYDTPREAIDAAMKEARDE